MKLKLSRTGKIYFILFIIFAITVPTTFYWIKKNQAGADVQLAEQNNRPVVFKSTPMAADLATKQGTINDLTDSARLKKLQAMDAKDLQKSQTLIVKMRKGKDINQIKNLLESKNQIQGVKTKIKSIKPLININTLKAEVAEQTAKEPQSKDRINKKFEELNLDQIFILETENQRDLDSQLSLIKYHPDVEYAEINGTVNVATSPNDPYYSSKGTWGQDYDDLWGLKKLRTEQAWDTTQGENTVIAVTDTGIDYNHEDLKDNIWTNSNEIAGNGIDDDNNGCIDDIYGCDFVNNDGDPMDDNGHGTHVSGTIAGIGNNNIGVIGVAPKTKLMALKGLGGGGSGYYTDLALTIYYAANNGAKVINASWSGYGYSQTIADAVSYIREVKGLVFVAAAGNSDDDINKFTPANIEGVVTVASTDQNDQRSADFSNWGEELDLAAPGGGTLDLNDPDRKYINILSIRAVNTNMYGDGRNIINEKYYRSRGTSMAAPHVTGVAALIASLNSNWNYQVIEEVLFNSVDDLGETGRDKYFGYGRINALKAIRLAKKLSKDSQPPTAPTHLIGKAIHTQRIDLSWSPSTDNKFLVGYHIYRDRTEIKSVNKNSFSDIYGLRQGTAYNYSIRAFDANNNLSPKTNIKVTTPTDETPPTAPTNLKATPFYARVDLSWSPSTDNYYLYGYSIYRDDNFYIAVSKETTKFSDNFVFPGEIHRFKIIAHDLEFNDSQPSNLVSVKIPERSFVDSGIKLTPPVSSKSVAWGDYDNDGDLDLAYGTSAEDDYYTQAKMLIYRNDGNNVFTDINAEALPEIALASVKWGDYDNDSDLDLAVAGSQFFDNDGDGYKETEEGLVDIYRNDGGSFVLYLSLSQRNEGSLAWGDYDNDGDLDLALTGYENKDIYTCGVGEDQLTLFQNVNNSFKEVNTQFMSGFVDNLTAADYDNDGDLDLLTSGGCKAQGGFKTANPPILYLNNGNFNFTSSSPIPDLMKDKVVFGDSAWGDYDNDGDLDLALTGYFDVDDISRKETIRLFNNHLGILKEVTTLGFRGNSLAWGDYDNDGDLDLLTVGSGTPWISTKIFRNEGNNEFIDIGPEVENMGLIGDASWGDYDNDGDLDIAVSGLKAFYPYNEFDFKIYKNRTADSDVFNKPNQKPNPPTNYSNKISGKTVTFAWSSDTGGRSDQETPQAGLYYNFRLGKTSGGQEIVSGTNGTPLLGNHLRPKFTGWLASKLFGRKINNLPSGKYFWSVQTIDTGLQTSDWGPEQILDIP